MGRKTAPVSVKESPTQVLITHLLLNLAFLKHNSPPHLSGAVKGLPLDKQSKYWPRHIRGLDEYLKESEERLRVLRRIASYLGLPWNVSRTPLQAARQARSMIQEGRSDQEIALFLDKYLRKRGDRGRPPGAAPDNMALRALELTSGRASWTWAKLADELLNCKVHQKHDSNDQCTGKLKQAVKRLRKFLEDLSSRKIPPKS